MSHDPQRRAVYRWEDSFRSFGERTATRRGVKALMLRAMRKYVKPLPKIRFLTRAASSGPRIVSEYDTNTHTITLGYNDVNHAVAMHEATHAILHALDPDAEDHGSKFLRVYIELLVWAKVAPRSALEASAREYGLKWRKK